MMIMTMLAPKIDNTKTIIAVKGFEITPVIFKNCGGDVVGCESDPALPMGLTLSIENKTCVMHGTPLSFSARTVYHITAHNPEGNSTTAIEITVVEAPIRAQREAIIHEHDLRGDLDTPRSQIDNAMSDQATMNSSIKPHEKFANQPMGDDKRLSQQTQNNPEAEHRAQQSPELTPSPSAKLQAQAVNAARPQMTPKPGA
jgi:hypothetical protein